MQLGAPGFSYHMVRQHIANSGCGARPRRNKASWTFIARHGQWAGHLWDQPESPNKVRQGEGKERMESRRHENGAGKGKSSHRSPTDGGGVHDGPTACMQQLLEVLGLCRMTGNCGDNVSGRHGGCTSRLRMQETSPTSCHVSF